MFNFKLIFMIKSRQIMIVIISIFVMSACNVEEKSKFDDEMTKQKQNQIEQKELTKKKYDPYEKARDEFFTEVLKLENKRNKAHTLKNAFAMSISKSSDETFLVLLLRINKNLMN